MNGTESRLAFNSSGRSPPGSRSLRQSRRHESNGDGRQNHLPPTPTRASLLRALPELPAGILADCHFESARLYEALASGPAAFIFAVIAVLEMLGVHMRLRVYRDPSPVRQLPRSKVTTSSPSNALLIVVTYAPTIIVNAPRQHRDRHG